MDELKALLRELQKSVDRNHEDIVTAESWARRVWSETGEALKTGFARVTETLPYLRFITKAPRFVLGTIASLAVGGYLARFVIYRKVVDESEKLGKEVLERNIRNVISTLDGVAKDPQTLELLVELLQQLLEEERTRANLLTLVLNLLETESLRGALLGLLLQLFDDTDLKHTTGVFALDALYTPDARRMLDTQLARLVSATVCDPQVQADTGIGVRRSLAHALVPSLPSWRRET